MRDGSQTGSQGTGRGLRDPGTAAAPDAALTDSPVSAGDLTRFAETFADLADPDVMSQAWQ